MIFKNIRDIINFPYNKDVGLYYQARLKKAKYKLLSKLVIGKILFSIFLAICYYFYNKYNSSL